MLSKRILLPATIALLLISQSPLSASSAKKCVYTCTPALTSHHHFYNGLLCLKDAAQLFQHRQEIDQKNLDQMMHCWEAAAKDLHAEAAYRLANLYEFGTIPSDFKGTKICAQNLGKALSYYALAAKFGHFQRFQSLESNINIYDAASYAIARINRELPNKTRSQALRPQIQSKKRFQFLTINPHAEPRPRSVATSTPITPLDSEPFKKEASDSMITRLSKSKDLVTEAKSTISKQEQA